MRLSGLSVSPISHFHMIDCAFTTIDTPAPQFSNANGTTTNRPMDITVDGALVADELAFNGTGSWDTWANVTITASLNAGANTIRATATTANGGPNVDYLDVQT